MEMSNKNNELDKTGFYYLGGFAGIGVGVFILSFVIISDVFVGGLFSKEALLGEPIQPWIERVIAHPKLSLLGLALPMIGFSLMLVVGMAIYQIIPKKSWSLTFSLVGYIIGVPLAVGQFLSAWSLARLISVDPQNSAQFSQIAASELNYFMIGNYIISPFFIIIIGNGLLCYTVLKLKFFPKWLCIWGMIAAIFIFIAFFTPLLPILGIFSLGGPLTMIWFILVGITLLKKANTISD